MDARVYGGVGAFFGFSIVATLLMLAPPWLSDREIYAFAAGGAIAGGIAGRLFLRAKQRGS
jgi:hypothetical protein